jgi:photosystem II stability/assembly factor-like uncharacterized protein
VLSSFGLAAKDLTRRRKGAKARRPLCAFAPSRLCVKNWRVRLKVLGWLVSCLLAASCAAPPAPAPPAPAARWAEGPAAGEQDLLGVDLVDESVGWAVGDIAPTGGAIFATSDGGRTWRPATRTTEVFAAVCFVDARRGWVVGYAGRIERTDDGGRSWTVQRVERGGEVLNSVWFVDADHGVAAGGGGIVLRTVDGGASWSPVPTGREEDLWCVRFATPERGWMVGEDGLVLATSDGGASWTPQPSGTTRALTGLAVASPSCLVAVGEGGTIVRSEDGATWAAAASGTEESLNAVAAAEASAVWAVGSNGVTLFSSDCGRSWSPATPVGNRTLFALDLVNPNRGVAVGRRGATALLP